MPLSVRLGLYALVWSFVLAAISSVAMLGFWSNFWKLNPVEVNLFLFLGMSACGLFFAGLAALTLHVLEEIEKRSKQ